MVKGVMKQDAAKKDPSLYRLLNARQFGLKMIANVTYGYTSAGFSGRMPMAELADTIVQTARETLEHAIRTVESEPRWTGAKVVYGDTDSLFVLLPGRSRQDAFRIGAEIAAKVTALNPKPVKLQMEKVFHPCVLMAKKRYVGYAYESASQTEPVFDAKGIETVRRDTCPLVAKTLERTLRLLFESKDLSLVRTYLEAQWNRVLSGKLSLIDFVFAKEVRLGTYSVGRPPPPAALVATKLMRADARAEPLYAERIPYVVVDGEPNAKLVDLVVPPQTLLSSAGRSGSGTAATATARSIAEAPQFSINARYYITKQINPAVARVLNLVGADVNAWFNSMPRPRAASIRALNHVSSAPPPYDHTTNVSSHAVRPSEVSSQHVPQAPPAQRLVIDLEDQVLTRTASTTGVLTSVAATSTVLQAHRPGRRRQASMHRLEKYYGNDRCSVCDEVIANSTKRKPGTIDGSAGRDRGDQVNQTRATETLAAAAAGVCADCVASADLVELVLTQRSRQVERQRTAAAQLCLACTGSYFKVILPDGTGNTDVSAAFTSREQGFERLHTIMAPNVSVANQCGSLDCPVVYQRAVLSTKAHQTQVQLRAFEAACPGMHEQPKS